MSYTSGELEGVRDVVDELHAEGHIDGYHHQILHDSIAALESGTCEVEVRESAWGGYTRHCGNCGADLDCDTRNRQNFCPNCGARVKAVDA